MSGQWYDFALKFNSKWLARSKKIKQPNQNYFLLKNKCRKSFITSKLQGTFDHVFV